MKNLLMTLVSALLPMLIFIIFRPAELRTKILITSAGTATSVFSVVMYLASRLRLRKGGRYRGK